MARKVYLSSEPECFCFGKTDKFSLKTFLQKKNQFNVREKCVKTLRKKRKSYLKKVD